METQNIEEIIFDYELGNIAEILDIQQQMALVEFTESLMGHTLVQVPVISEMAKNGRFLRFVMTTNIIIWNPFKRNTNIVAQSGISRFQIDFYIF